METLVGSRRWKTAFMSLAWVVISLQVFFSCRIMTRACNHVLSWLAQNSWIRYATDRLADQFIKYQSRADPDYFLHNGLISHEALLATLVSPRRPPPRLSPLSRGRSAIWAGLFFYWVGVSRRPTSLCNTRWSRSNRPRQEICGASPLAA